MKLAFSTEEFLIGFAEAERKAGRPPTVREVQEALNASSPSVANDHIKRAIEGGLAMRLDSRRGSYRNVTLTSEGRKRARRERARRKRVA